MNPQDDFISIAEFAKIAGITPTAVYKKIRKQVHEPNDNQFMNHIKTVDGKKRINKAALSLFNTNNSEPVHEPVCEPVHEPNENQMLDILQEQLRVKDSQIESLSKESNKQLEIKDIQIAELNKANNRLNDRLQEVNQLNHQNQILLLGKQPEQTEIEDIPEPAKKSFWDRFKRKEH